MHVALLAILGHERCGAVQAALDGGHVPVNVVAITKDIAPAARLAKSKGLDGPHTVDAAVRENVRLQMKRVVAESELLRVAKKELRIVGGIYRLESGKVEWFE